MNFACESKLFTFCFSLLLLQQAGCTSRPAILSEPADITVSRHVTSRGFTILCIKSQDSEVEWYRNRQPINIQHDPELKMTKDGSLHVKIARKERDEGSYYCSVSIGKKVLISRTATVKFAYLKPFSKRYLPVHFNQGDKAVLECQAPDSFPHRAIQWTIRTAGGDQPMTQSVRYAVSQEGDLHFAYVDKTDAGNYACTVTNVFLMKQYVKNVALRVKQAGMQLYKPPKVADQFAKTKIALKGQKFVLECIVYGKPVPRITLRKIGLRTKLGRTTGIINRLVIDSFTRDDAGKYECKASDQSGLSETKTTLVKMEAKPEWITKPQDTTSGFNTTVILPCLAFGIPSVQYTWFFNGKQMVSTERHGFSNGNLTIRNLTTVDNGMYQCFAKNKHGQLHADVEINVLDIPAGFGPGSKSPQSKVKALINTTVQLTCRPTGTPKPTIGWRFGPMNVQDSGRHRILSNGTLRISDVTTSDRGEYTCVASNRLGNASRKAFLEVKEYIVTKENMPEQEKISVKLGHNIRFSCGVRTTSGIEVTFHWYKLFEPVVSNLFLRTWRTDRTNNLSHNVQKGYLKINGAKYSDKGLYTCKAMGNGKVITTEDVYLIVQGPPDPPRRVRIVHEPGRNDSVNVTWVLGKANDSPIRKIIIQYTTQFSPNTWKTRAEEHQPANKGRIQIRLSPWLRYTFRAITVNDIGNSTPSAQSSTIQVPAAAPSRYPLEVKGEGISPTSLSITWKPFLPINHNGPGLYYIVYHQRADGKGEKFRNEVRNASSFNVTAADFYVKYTIQLQAANDIGFGPKSPVVFGYTGEKVPVGAPRDLDVRITSPTLAYATWTGVPDTREAIRGKLLGYKVYFWKTPSGQTPDKSAKFQKTKDTSTTLHLQAFASYRFQVVAYNSVGDGPASNVVGPLTTPESVPDSPRTLSLNVQNQSYIVMRWEPPEHINGVISSYQVTAQKLPALTTAITWITNDSNTEVWMDHLDPKALYKVSVLAINRMGKGPPVVVTFDLSAAPQVAPYDVKASFNDLDKEARLSWKSSATDIEGFRIFYWGTNGNLQILDVDKTRRKKKILFGLENEHMLHFQIAAFKIIHGGHYIVGPRSQQVTAGNVPVRDPSRTHSMGSVNNSPSALLLSTLVLFLMSLQWLQVR